MYSVKEAQITKEHLPSVEDIHIYYMDMRAYGKDFDRYIKSGEDKYGNSSAATCRQCGISLKTECSD